ncbi:MAG: Gfo/Idh/MocA family oxidoreductase, partial [Candidatus Hodarchaeota archaeon]
MNIIIVGMGGHAASSWLHRINEHPEWNLVGIVDTDTEKLLHVEKWGVPEDCAYPNIEAAVKWGDEKIDLALITSPIPTHHVLATEAMELGLNVIVEKNMALTIEQGQDLVKLARKNPELSTSLGTQYPFRPKWYTLREMFKSGKSPIGKLSLVRMRSSAYSGDMRTHWRAWLGDIFPDDMMVHHVSILRYATAMEIIKVSAQVFRPAWSTWLGSSTVLMNMVMAPPGKEIEKDEWINAQYYGDWQGTGLKSGWEDNYEFYGPRGSIRFEPSAVKQREAVWMDMWQVVDGIKLIGEPGINTLTAYINDEKRQKVEVRELETKKDIEGRVAQIRRAIDDTTSDYDR